MNEQNPRYNKGDGNFVYGTNLPSGNRSPNLYYALDQSSIGYHDLYGDGYLMLSEFNFKRFFEHGDGICDNPIIDYY